ncbi:MAG: 2-dehydropantoate 2-reductase [Spirochaetota bacterium]
MAQTKVLFVGSGAVGSFYASVLDFLPGVEVSLFCRSDYETIRQKGIRVESVLRNRHFHPKQVLSYGQSSLQEFDFILVCLKALPQIQLQSILHTYVTAKTCIVLLQNGIGAENQVAKEFPENEVLGGLAFTCINRLAPGFVQHIDYGQLNIGSYSRRNISPAVQSLQQLFESAGITCQTSANIVQARWKKLIWNVPFNSLSVLTGGSTTYELLQNPHTLRLVKEIMAEVMALSEKEGHLQQADTIETYIEMTAKMKPYKTSMLLDFENHREMEVEAILGAPLVVAQRHNMKVPHLSSIYALLQQLNQKNTTSSELLPTS